MEWNPLSFSMFQEWFTSHCLLQLIEHRNYVFNCEKVAYNVIRFASIVVVAVVVYFVLSRLLYLAFSANLGLLFMSHPGMGALV